MNFEYYDRLEGAKEQASNIAWEMNEQDAFTDAYLSPLDELERRLATLQRSGVEDVSQLEAEIYEDVADYMMAINPHNFEERQDGFDEFLEVYVGEVEELEEVTQIPQEFYEVVAYMGYSPDVTTDYYRAYCRYPEFARLDSEEMMEYLRGLRATIEEIQYLTGTRDEAQNAEIMAEGFSFLIQSDWESFQALKDRVNLVEDYNQAKEAEERNRALTDRLNDLNRKCGELDSLLLEQWEHVQQLQRERGGWYQDFGGAQRERLEVNLLDIHGLTARREVYGKHAATLEDQILENDAIIYGFQYRSAVANGAPRSETDRLLIDLAKTLGEHLPEDLNSAMDEAKNRLREEGLTDFEKAYYLGEENAVQVAIEEYNNGEEGAEERLTKALLTDPALIELQDVAEVASRQFGVLTESLQAAMSEKEMGGSEGRGNRTPEYVLQLKTEAERLLSVYDGPHIKELMSEADISLNALSQLKVGEEMTEFEKTLTKTKDGLAQFSDLVRQGSVEQFCSFIIDDSFRGKSFENWMATHGVVLTCAIGAGLAAMTGAEPVALALGGKAAAVLTAGGYVTLAWNAAFMAGGSVIGSEIGAEVSDLVFDTGMESNFRRWQEGEMSFDELAKGYAKQFGWSWALSFMFMGAGRAFVNAGTKDIVLLSRVSQETQKVAAKMKLSPSGSMAGGLERMCMQYAEEMGEEIAEDVANNVNPVLGAAVTFWNCLDGRNVVTDLAPDGVTQIAQTFNGGQMESTFEYLVGSVEQMMMRLRQYAGEDVSVDQNGVVTARLASEVNGKVFLNTMTFNPTGEPLAMRNTMRKGLKSGEVIDSSVLIKHYGLRFDEKTGEYTYKTLRGEGRATWLHTGLLPYLESDGYIISDMDGDGTFSARKGEVEVDFRPRGRVPREDLEIMAKISDSDRIQSSDGPAGHVFRDMALEIEYKQEMTQLRERYESGEIDEKQFRQLKLALNGQANADRLTHVVQYFENNMAELVGMDPEEMVDIALADLAEQGVIIQRPRLRKMMLTGAKDFDRQCQGIMPWRDKVKTAEGKREFLDAINLDWIKADDVEILLDHPIFIGVRFKSSYDFGKYYLNGHNSDKQAIQRIGDGIRGFVRIADDFKVGELNRKVGFLNAGNGFETMTHEFQHLLFREIYSNNIRFDLSGRLGRYADLYGRPREEYIFLNEVLASLKEGQYQLNEQAVLGGRNMIWNDLRKVDEELRAKWTLMDQFFRDAQDKGIKAEELWLRCQVAASIDDCLQRMYDTIYTYDEKKVLLKVYESRVEDPAQMAEWEMSDLSSVDTFLQIQNDVLEATFFRRYLSSSEFCGLTVPAHASLAEMDAIFEDHVRSTLDEEAAEIVLADVFYAGDFELDLDRKGVVYMYKTEKEMSDLSPDHKAELRRYFKENDKNPVSRAIIAERRVAEMVEGMKFYKQALDEIVEFGEISEREFENAHRFEYLDQQHEYLAGVLLEKLEAKAKRENPDSVVLDLIHGDEIHPLFGRKEVSLVEGYTLYSIENRYPYTREGWNKIYAELSPKIKDLDDTSPLGYALDLRGLIEGRVSQDYQEIIRKKKLAGDSFKEDLTNNNLTIDEQIARLDEFLERKEQEVLSFGTEDYMAISEKAFFNLEEIARKNNCHFHYFGDSPKTINKKIMYSEMQLESEGFDSEINRAFDQIGPVLQSVGFSEKGISFVLDSRHGSKSQRIEIAKELYRGRTGEEASMLDYA